MPACLLCGDPSPSEVTELSVFSMTFSICGACSEGLERARLQWPKAIADWPCVHSWAANVWSQNWAAVLRGYECRHHVASHRRLQARLDAGELRAHCPCESCRIWRGVLRVKIPLPDFGEAAVFRLASDGGLISVPDSVPLAVLRSLNDETPIRGGDGEVRLPADEIARRIAKNKAETAYPGMKPGGNADLAYRQIPKMAEHVLLSKQLSEVQSKIRSVQDRRAKAWWQDCADLQPGESAPMSFRLRDIARRRQWCQIWDGFHPEGGYYDGPYWVDLETGECHRIPDISGETW